MESIKHINTYFPINVRNVKPGGQVESTLINESNEHNGNKSLAEQPVELALFKEHYFINESVGITNQYVVNYNEYKDHPRYNVLNLRTVSKKNDVPYFKAASDSKNTSFDLIRCMFDYNYFEEITEVNEYNYETLI